MSRLKINSDFNDYYDILSSESTLTYNRFLNGSPQRASDLKFLRRLGLKTIELKPVSSFLMDSGYIVVYTKPNMHNGKGKKILTVGEANTLYSNFTASSYLIPDNGYTIKVLQIGERRFTLVFQKANPISLDIGQLISITENSREYNRLIGLPIFSIDYIIKNNEMIATDFNRVEKLDRLGIHNYIKPEEVINQIRGALIAYNKT